MSEMCCTRLAKYRIQKLRKKSPSAHHRTNLSGYIFATKTCIDNQKRIVKQRYLLHMSSQCGEISRQVCGTPANFNGFRVLALLLIAPTSLNRSQQNFARCLAVSWAGTLYVHFWGLLSPNGILSGAEFTLRPSLPFSYIAIVTARHSSRQRQPNCVAWYKEWNYGTLGLVIVNRGRHLYSEGGHHVGHRPTF